MSDIDSYYDDEMDYVGESSETDDEGEDQSETS